jgi:DNA-binding winged helix-turn-helix (wHTH) protein
VTFERFVLDPDARTLVRDSRPIAMYAKAYDLLCILIANAGAAVTRERLYEELWPEGDVEDGNLTQHIYLVRRLLDPNGNGRRFIQTLPRHGYRFAARVTPVAPPQASERRFGLQPAFRALIVAALVSIALLVRGAALENSASPLGNDASLSYALGVYHFNMRTPRELQRSIAYFTQTVRAAPSNALGYAGLAEAHAIVADSADDGSMIQRQNFALAQRYRDEALERDPGNAEAHTVAGFLAYRYEGDPARGERELQLAIASKPGYATAHHWQAVLLFSQGRIADAEHEWELAHQLDPTSEVISRWLGTAYFYERRPEDAIRVLAETISIEPEDVDAWMQLASAQEQRGAYGDALHTLESVRRTVPHKATYIALQEAYVRVVAHHGALDRRTIAVINRFARYNQEERSDVAMLMVALGRRDEAIAMLSKARPHTHLDLTMEKDDPRFASLRSDPRFIRLFD